MKLETARLGTVTGGYVWGRSKRQNRAPGRAFSLLVAMFLSVVIALASASQVNAAAPRIMLVTGRGLPNPVVLDNWEENLNVMLAAGNAVDPIKEELASRTNFRVAMFWGKEWDDYIRSGNDPRSLRPDQAGQYGNYFPPAASHDAVFAFDTIPGGGDLVRRFSVDGVSIFARHGIGPYPTAPGPLTIVARFLADHSRDLMLLFGAAGVGGLWLVMRFFRRRVLARFPSDQ